MRPVKKLTPLLLYDAKTNSRNCAVAANCSVGASSPNAKSLNRGLPRRMSRWPVLESGIFGTALLYECSHALIGIFGRHNTGEGGFLDGEAIVD